MTCWPLPRSHLGTGVWGGGGTHLASLSVLLINDCVAFDYGVASYDLLIWHSYTCSKAIATGCSTPLISAARIYSISPPKVLCAWRKRARLISVNT